LDGKTYRTPIKTLRGDYRKADGSTGNRLRFWAKSDFKPHPDDIFQERLYAIQWITKDTLNTGRRRGLPRRRTPTFSASSSGKIVAENLSRWQDEGWCRTWPLSLATNTTQPIRERGWTHWHHLFNAGRLLLKRLC
jgi:putative DNA methylase